MHDGQVNLQIAASLPVKHDGAVETSAAKSDSESLFNAL
jgi:hypothetical protein